MARFHYPHEVTAEEECRAKANPYGPLPEASNPELCRDFFEKLAKSEAEHLDKERIYCS